MAANLSNIAFFDISEDQFTGIKPLEFTLDFGGNDYTDEELDESTETYGEEFKSFANFAIQIDIDKKITLGHLGEYILKSDSLWNLATRKVGSNRSYPQWYLDLQNAIDSTKNVIGSTSSTSKYWTWSQLIRGYGGLIPLIEEISSLLGSISLTSDISDTAYQSWSDWKKKYSSITGWIRDNSGYLDKILGTNWTSYNEFNSLPVRLLRLESFTGVPTGGSVLPPKSLSQQIIDINTALGSKSDKAGTDTIYGRLNQLETLKDSSSQLSDTIGGFSTGTKGDPLTNKVKDLTEKGSTIFDLYQYLAPQTYDPDDDIFSTEGGNLNLPNLDLPNGNNMVSALFKDSLFPAVYIKDTQEVNIDWGHTYIMDSYYSPYETSADVVKKFFVLALPESFRDKITVNSLNVVIPKLILPAIPEIEGSTSIKSLYNLNRIKIYVRGIGSISGESSIGLYGIRDVFPVGYIVNDTGKTILANFYSNKIVNLLSSSLSVSPVITETNNLFTNNNNQVHTLFDIRNIGDGTFLNGGVVGFPYINISPSGLAFILARMAIIDIWYNPAAPGDIHWSMQLIFPTHSAVGVPRMVIEFPQKTQ